MRGSGGEEGEGGWNQKKLINALCVLIKFMKIIFTILNIQNLKGIILETYGAGNAPTEKWFIKLLENAINNGLHIVNVTQCSGGSVSMELHERINQKNSAPKLSRPMPPGLMPSVMLQ